MEVPIAHNVCTKCKYQWHDMPGAWAKASQCPRCESDYWEWRNYPIEKFNYCRICDKEFGAKK